MIDILAQLRKELRSNSDKKVRESGLRFFKEKVNMYGMKSAAVVAIAKKYRRQISGKKEILALCEKLWQSGYMEESFIACSWAYSLSDEFKPEDFRIFERWVKKYVTNWASCDTLCNHTVGDFIEKYPAFLAELKNWAKSDNRWVRRASVVSLIIPARHGKFLKDVFELADILLLDEDDLVQKGYGWALKAASQAHQKEVFEYVIRNKEKMPRTALRYAIEKMPKELKAKAMAK